MTDAPLADLHAAAADVATQLAAFARLEISRAEDDAVVAKRPATEGETDNDFEIVEEKAKASEPAFFDTNNLPRMQFAGALRPSYMIYAMDACQMCYHADPETTCGMCAKSVKHRQNALVQPYPTCMCTTPKTFADLLRVKARYTPYHMIVIGYEAVYAHLVELTNASVEMLTPEWTDGARDAREKARALWNPYIERFKREHRDAFAIGLAPDEGRAALLRAYERVLIAGTLAVELWDRAGELDAAVETRCANLEPLECWKTDAIKLSASTIAALDRFNDKHAEFALINSVDKKLKI